MKAIGFDGPGNPAELMVCELPEPTPGPGEVRVRVAACGINPVDVKLSRSGFPGWEWPHVPGIDVVGWVDAIGEGVSEEWLGQRVAAHHNLKHQGGLAEAVCVDADVMAAVPDQLEAVLAATVPCPGLTAYQAVTRTGVRAGQLVLVTGAGGAVGTFAVQLALRAGAAVDALAAGRDSDRLAALGVRRVVDYRDPDAIAMLQAAARDRTESPGDNEHGYDVVLDLVTPGTETAPLIRYNGVIASTIAFPDLSGVESFTTVPAAMHTALGAVFWYGSRTQRQELGRELGKLLEDVAAGELDPPPPTAVALEDIPAAWVELSAGRLPGKIVATVASES